MRPDPDRAAAAPFRPSDYSAALVHAMHAHPDWVRGARVLDVGCGSGVLLAVAGATGAARLTGVDIEPDAVAETRALLDAQGLAAIADVRCGSLFGPVAGQAFDLVLANLPHFPMAAAQVDGRCPSWSAGGPDGRALMDRFLGGLAAHLAPEGRALVMHNAFIGLETTETMARDAGLAVQTVATLTLPIPPQKRAVMAAAVLRRETGRSIHLFGAYAFGSVSILSLTHAADAGQGA